MTHERRDLHERYSSAIESSHLEVTLEVGDVDMLVAAGWTHESLGTLLFRLLVEFDGVRGDYRLAVQALRAAELRARQLSRSKDPARLEKARAELRAAEAAAMTEKALMLIAMKSLPEARRALGAFAIQLATRRRYMRNDADVLAIAGRALSAFLDPLCGVCDGRGFSGGVGTPKVICAPCHGTGRREARLGSDNPSHRFGRELLVEMDLMVVRVARKMKRFLRRDIRAGA